jgi:hypothetical protein
MARGAPRASTWASNASPDATTLLSFRRPLQTHKPGEALFDKVGVGVAGARAGGHGHDRGCHDPRPPGAWPSMVVRVVLVFHGELEHVVVQTPG